MGDSDPRERALQLLQQLGLKEYESKCFVALTSLPHGTARDVSDSTDVPRTRVYDAVGVLESMGLVETQASTPQRFRAIPIDEAIARLRRQYDDRFDELEGALRSLEARSGPPEQDVPDVWTIAESDAVEHRICRLLADAAEEIVLLVADERSLSRRLTGCFSRTSGDASVVVGTRDDGVRDRLREAVPDARTIDADLDWLWTSVAADVAGSRLGRILLVDRRHLLISTGRGEGETAVVAEGPANGLVVLARRLLVAGFDATALE